MKYTAAKMTMTIGDREYEVSNVRYSEREPDLSEPLRTIGRAFGTFQMRMNMTRESFERMCNTFLARAGFNVRKATRSAWTRSMLMTLVRRMKYRGGRKERSAARRILQWQRTTGRW